MRKIFLSRESEPKGFQKRKADHKWLDSALAGAPLHFTADPYGRYVTWFAAGYDAILNTGPTVGSPLLYSRITQ